MYNRSLLQSYLKKTAAITACQIWMYHPMEQRWIFIDQLEPFKHISSHVFLHTLPETSDNCLILEYPQEYRVKLVFKTKALVDQETKEIIYHLLHPIYSYFTMKSKDIELDKLIEGIKNITASLDLDELLTKILDNVAAVIPGANTSAFWLYNPAIDRLVCKAYRGWQAEIEKVQYKIGESVTGKTYRDGKPRVYYSFRKANEAMKGTSKSNAELLKAAFHNGRVKATVTVPVNFHDEIKGVLGIHQDSEARRLTEWDIQLIKALAAQIAIAIENAHMFTEIKRKNQVLIKRNEVHASLTKLSLQNKGVGAIAAELNRMIKPSVTFVDLLEEEYYPKMHKQYFTVEELYKFISHRHMPFYIEKYDIDEKTFLIYPIYVGNVCAGCLIVLGEPPLVQLEHMIVERGGVFLSLELAKRHSIAEVYYKKIHDYYHELLNNEHSDLLYKQGLDLGIDLNNHVVSIIVELSNFQDLQVLEAKVHHFVWTIKQRLTETSKLVFGNHNKVTLLLSLDSPAELLFIVKTFESILASWQQSENIKLYAGIGRIYCGIPSISKTHNEAEKALYYLQSKQTSGVIQYSEIGINRLFLNHTATELLQFTEEIFSPLHQKQQELEETLITYIKCNRSATKTAATLHVHINTLYQRIKRIEEILNLSFEDPENILKIQLACHFKEAYT
ncbi:helix-turn-helix domain-containing protein [Cytobacillus purgationiresistens]|nr:helix-turn-helix domain-containing protein [Cytobacillus purgationiresistens]